MSGPNVTTPRTPPDGSVTDVKVAAGAAIAKSKLDTAGGLVVVDADVSPTAAIAAAKIAGTAETQDHKGQPNGYASLDGTGKVPSAQVPNLTVSRFLGAGHSLASDGGGASYPDDACWVKTGKLLGCTRLDSIAQGGAVLSVPEGTSIGSGNRYAGIGRLLQFVSADLYRTAYPYLPVLEAAMVMWGANDMAWMGPAIFTSVFPLALTAAIQRLRAGAVFEDTDASVAYTGASWASVAIKSVNSGTQVKQVTTNGQSLTITVPADFPGGTLALRFVTGAAGQGALWTITGTGCASGVSTTFDTRTINGFANAGTIGSNGAILNCVKRLTGLPAGGGTITVTATTINSVAYFDCWEIESPTPPLIALPLHPRFYAYTAFSGWPYPGIGDSDITGASNSVNSAVQQVANSFDQYVFTIPLDDVLNKQQIYFENNGAGGDNLHPNDLGHALLANRLETNLRTQASQLVLAQPLQIDKRWFKPLDGTGDTAFTTPNPWGDAGGTYVKVGFHKDYVAGRVSIRGAVTKTTGAATDYIFQLPIGFRPVAKTDIGCSVFNGAAMQAALLRVNAGGNDGGVQFAAGGSIAASSICPITCSFLAEA